MPIEDYLAYLTNIRHCSDATIKSYKIDLVSWNNWMLQQGIEWNKIDLTTIRSFLGAMSREKLSSASVNRRLSSLKGFYNWLLNHKMVDVNPFIQVKSLKKPRKLPSYLTSKEFDNLLAHAGSGFNGLRNRAILELLFSTGCRVSEICSLRRDKALKHDMRIVGKGKKERIVFVGEYAMAALKDYVPLRDERLKMKGLEVEQLFINERGGALSERGLFYIIDKISKKAGLSKKISPHTLRHSFATQLVDEGANIRMVQEMLGHASMSTTQIYTHSGIEQIKRVYRESHPHSRRKLINKGAH